MKRFRVFVLAVLLALTTLVVSAPRAFAAPSLVSVPDLTNMTASDADAALSAVNLVGAPGDPVLSGTVGVDRVAGQNPEPGVNNANENDTVIYYLEGVEVPSVAGKTQAEATSELTAAGLSAGTINESFSDTVPKGSVISQDPAAGEVVFNGSSVDLVISKGKEQVSVPNVVGKTQADATSALTAAGLNAGTITESFSDTVEKGKVISQTPAASSTVDKGSKVDLVISKGKEQVSVPNVVGKTQADAKTELTAVGLNVGTVTEKYDSSVEKGKVISQTPAASSTVDKGSKVDLVISKGPEMVKVPDVKGKSESDAKSALTSAGFTVTTTTEYSETVAKGNVISQDPVANTNLEKGSAVSIVISDGIQTGWIEKDGKKYYRNEDGSYPKGLKQIDGEYYFFENDGSVYTGGWKVIDGYYFYFGTDGVRYHDKIATYGGDRYYLKSNGRVLTGWLNVDGTWYYAGSNGKLYTSKWLYYSGKYYYFKADSKLLINGIAWYGGSAYWMGSSATPVRGWISYGGTWYYAGSNYKLYRNQWVSYAGSWYYMGSDCKIQTTGGWIKSGGNWYYMYSTGTYAKGWNNIGGKWYYFNTDYGYLFTSRYIKTNGVFYYVNYNGQAVSSCKAPDGATIDANGKRVSGPADSKAQGYSSSTGYLILVNYTYHTVNVYTGSRNNWSLTQCFPCSMGKDSTKTPTGTYHIYGKTYSFGDSDHTCYYASGFIGMSYLLHSVLYEPGTWTIKDGRLGVNISNGCIRLHTDDAYWIYKTVPVGTPVIIYY